MAPTVLGLGIPAQHELVPWVAQRMVQKSINFMNTDMDASPYDWEMFYIDQNMDYSQIRKKLHEKHWDIVMLGRGLRTIDALTPLMEKIVNTVHEELPKTKIAFNTTIEKTRESCNRVHPVE